MKKIVFEEYESFLEQIKQEDQSNQDYICIDFQSLVDHLETIEQVLVLQMALAKIHKRCILYFPYPGKEKMTETEYEAYKRELQKLQNIQLCLEEFS